LRTRSLGEVSSLESTYPISGIGRSSFPATNHAVTGSSVWCVAYLYYPTVGETNLMDYGNEGRERSGFRGLGAAGDERFDARSESSLLRVLFPEQDFVIWRSAAFWRDAAVGTASRLTMQETGCT
jgi:hypothetical protein